jgi:hypothetical protein
LYIILYALGFEWIALALALVMIQVDSVVEYNQRSVYILRSEAVKDHYPWGYILKSYDVVIIQNQLWYYILGLFRIYILYWDFEHIHL